MALFRLVRKVPGREIDKFPPGAKRVTGPSILRTSLPEVKVKTTCPYTMGKIGGLTLEQSGTYRFHHVTS